jgi:recombination protein RecA
MYGKGIYRMGEIIDLGVKLNLLDKSGAWYAYKGEKVGQGKKNVATYLEENPAMAKEIEEQIRAQLLGGANNLLIAADVENAEVGLD